MIRSTPARHFPEPGRRPAGTRSRRAGGPFSRPRSSGYVVVLLRTSAVHAQVGGIGRHRRLVGSGRRGGAAPPPGAAPLDHPGDVRPPPLPRSILAALRPAARLKITATASVWTGRANVLLSAVDGVVDAGTSRYRVRPCPRHGLRPDKTAATTRPRSFGKADRPDDKDLWWSTRSPRPGDPGPSPAATTFFAVHVRRPPPATDGRRRSSVRRTRLVARRTVPLERRRLPAGPASCSTTPAATGTSSSSTCRRSVVAAGQARTVGGRRRRPGVSRRSRHVATAITC